MVEIDAIDRRILAALQENNLISAERLGERVGLSVTAVQRRCKRLRAAKVITADISVIDPKALGRGATFIVEVTLERESADVVERFKQKVRSRPEIQQCYYITGEADFLLILTAADTEAYEELIASLFVDDRDIRKFKTGVVLNRVKTTLAIDIDADP